MADTFDAPQSRNEAILQNILGAENELGEPQSRIEELLQQILEQGSGGGKLYLHQVRTDTSNSSMKCDGFVTIINKSETAFTFNTLWDYLKANAENYPIVGCLYDKSASKLYNLYRIYPTMSNETKVFSLNYMTETGSYGYKSASYFSITDVVIAI